MGKATDTVITITYVVVELRSCCDGSVTRFVFPNTPVHFVTTGVYHYIGTNNFPNTDGTFLEPGKCYTATLQTNLPIGAYPMGPPVTNIPMIDFGCNNQICIDACAPPTCGCPFGYSLNADGICQKIEFLQPICSPKYYTVVKGSILCNDSSTVRYGLAGGIFYADVTNLPWPILASGGSFLISSVLSDASLNAVPVVNTIQNNVWGSSTGSLANCPNYRLNKVGVWAPPPGTINQWIGFSFCANIPATKTYYIGVAADNAYRLFINGNMILDSSTSSYNFSSWKIIPLTVSAGQNVIEVRGINYGGLATLGFEIYDATLAQLMGVTTANGTPGPNDLNQYILFTTESLIGSLFQTGETTGCHCPDGYSLYPCDGGLQCLQVLTAPQVTCNITLTPCCGGGTPVIIDNSVLLYYIGEIVCIQDIDPNVGCWTIGITTDPVNYTGPVTLGNYTATCEECVSLGCKTCPDFYFTLNDCCTNEPYLNNLGEILILHYTGESVNGITPSSLANVVITEILSDLIIIPVATGCLILTEVNPTDFTTPTDIKLWEVLVNEVTSVATCNDCKDCGTCYLLTNCTDDTDNLVTGTDLSQYIDYVITIEGCKDKCYIVTLAQNCDACSQPIVIINSFPPIVTSSTTPDCNSCLPPAVPVVQPLLLNTRPVNPGYTTPGCSPEYTEKVNTNFSDQVYAQMLSVRYGLTTCCQEDLEYWEIKKQLLDFKAINDNNLTDCNNV